ncbi:MAG: hypothetical protein MJ003_05020 [Paludibacteraceae bacterium]|nr:hypothetical protein [Paludibacteraceae bacterium]
METKNLLKSLKRRLSWMLCLVALLSVSQIISAEDIGFYDTQGDNDVWRIQFGYNNTNWQQHGNRSNCIGNEYDLGTITTDLYIDKDNSYGWTWGAGNRRLTLSAEYQVNGGSYSGEKEVLYQDWSDSGNQKVIFKTSKKIFSTSDNPGNYVYKYYLKVTATNASCNNCYCSNNSNNMKIKFTIPGFSPSTGTKDFGSVNIGGNKEETISLTHYGSNTGIKSSTITGINADQFSKSDVSSSSFKVKFTPTSAGSKTATVTITDNYDKTYKLTVTGTGVQPKYYVAGSFTNWGDNQVELESNGDGTYSKSITLTVNTEHKFKIREDEQWYGKDGGDCKGSINRSSTSIASLESGNNLCINADVAGSYTFTYTPTGRTISVTYPPACETPTQQEVSIGDATICSSSSTTISTTTSQSSYKYQLARQNGSSWDNVGTAVDGGSALRFENINTAGTYKIYGYLSTDETCKADMKNTVALSVDAAPVATSVSGAGAVCSDKTKTLTLASGYKGSLQWEKSDAQAGTYSPITDKTSTTYTTTAGEAGWYRVSVKNGVCDAAYTTPVQVTVDAKPTLGAVSGAGAVCTGSTKTLTLNNHTQTINWQKSASQSGTYTTIPNTTGLTSYGATEAGWYRVQATNGVCDAVNNTGVQVTVDQPTVAGTITGAGDICSGNTKELSSSGATATNYKWKSCLTEDGTYVDATGTINKSKYSANPTVSTYYKLSVKNGECSWAYTAPVRVVVNNKPAQPGVITSSVTAPCINATGLGYSITEVATATGYTWTVPAGWNITAGAGTHSITATAGTAGGSIKVTANNDCGSSAEQTLAVTVKGKTISVSPTTVNAKKYTPTAITATTDGDVTWAVTGTNNYLLNADKTVYTSGNVKQITVKAVSSGNVTATTTNDGCETSATVTLSPSDDTETCN